MATHLFVSSRLTSQLSDVYCYGKCLDRVNFSFSDAMLDREEAVKLTLTLWDHLWEEIVSSENWTDDVTIECLLLMELMWNRNEENLPRTLMKDTEDFLNKDASNSDIRYILTVLREQVIALRKLRLNGGISGESSS